MTRHLHQKILPLRREQNRFYNNNNMIERPKATIILIDSHRQSSKNCNGLNIL